MVYMALPVIQNHEQQRNGGFSSSGNSSTLFLLRQRSLEVSWGRRTKSSTSRYYNYDSLDCLEPLMQSSNTIKVRSTAVAGDDAICKEQVILVSCIAHSFSYDASATPLLTFDVGWQSCVCWRRRRGGCFLEEIRE